MKSFASVSILAVFLCISAVAQSTSRSSVSGIVSDENGDLVIGARVTLTGRGNGITFTTSTNGEGKFVFQTLAPGEYTVCVDARGFGKGSHDVKVRPSEKNDLTLTLRIGESRTTVTAEVGVREEIVNVPQPVSLVDADKIMIRATSALAQAGAEEAGLNVQRTSSTLGAIVIRGLTGKNVVNFVDGVRYTNGAQRGGINTFFNLNESTMLESVEVLRGPNGALYGSDSLAGTVNLVTLTPLLGSERSQFQGEFNPSFSSASRAFGSNLLIGYGYQRFGGYVNLAARRINDLRTADGLDSHSAITRFLGLPSSILYVRNPGTGFTQYGGAVRLSYAPRDDQQISFLYQRSQQDGGRRFDQLIGGDGNLIADLRDLKLDFGYLRYVKQGIGPFDTASVTASFNSQREERVNQGGQGNPFGDITHQYERTSVWGISFFLEKQLGRRNNVVLGGDAYLERIKSPAFTVNPLTNVSLLSRPRIPDHARFDSAGIFVQDAWEAIRERLRITGAIRFGGMRYRVRAADSPLINGRPLWSDDKLSTADISGRIGAVIRVSKGLRLALNYSRGFRYPSMTDLGTLGLTGDGFEIDHMTSGALGGTIGTTASADAVSTGLPVSKQRSEISHNFDVGLRYENRRFDTELTVFRLDINDAITKQALILPAGAVGQFLGDQQVSNQLPSGVVFVAASTSPVLVRANFTSARTFGVEYEAEGRLTDSLMFRGNFTYIRSEDKQSGLPPNIEGGTPPPNAFLSLKWSRPRYWIEAYSTLAAQQDRLSSLDLSDRRTGAARTRTQIANFIRRGACVRGLTINQSGTGCVTTLGNPTYILVATGETLEQVQDRVLPGVGDNVAVPLFTHLPGYGTINLRGGVTINEKTRINAAFENIFDQSYRNPSWGIDGPGRSLTLQLRYKF